MEPVSSNASTNNKPLIIGAVVIFLVVLLAAITYEVKNTKKQDSEVTEQKPTTTQMETVKPAESTSTSAVASFKDGTYSAEGDYIVHIGPKHINVTLTLKNNIITDANVKNEADDKTSVNYQNKFISGYKEFVIGKSIVGLHLTKVSGSSLTPNGFNDALQKIETQAKS